jgi:hypothetical protein
MMPPGLPAPMEWFTFPASPKSREELEFCRAKREG